MVLRPHALTRLSHLALLSLCALLVPAFEEPPGLVGWLVIAAVVLVVLIITIRCYRVRVICESDAIDIRGVLRNRRIPLDLVTGLRGPERVHLQWDSHETYIYALSAGSSPRVLEFIQDHQEVNVAALREWIRTYADS